jgi:cation diffusion facilitator CzcD-associated flavoprotein CzcO
MEHVNVLIVGAGLSGVGAAYHLQTSCPHKSYTIFEARDAIGGTWDLFRYPGVRSDSDMYTLGYRFKPWENAKSIADGSSILSYVRETAREHGIDQQVRFQHRVVRAAWSTEEQRWTVEAVRGGAHQDDRGGGREANGADAGETVQITCDFLFLCSGYYRYDEGYTPELPGVERFQGRIVHPQFWPGDVDYAGKRVVVIGSGATAVTLVPALAGVHSAATAPRAAHVTMLQRSPSYVVSLPAEDPLAGKARRILPSRWAYGLIRWKNVLLTMLSFQLSRKRPETMKRLLRKGLESQLPEGFDIDTHFTPRYNPWDQRLCLVPDGDLFEAIGDGRASIATGRIETFTERGIRLVSGQEGERAEGEEHGAEGNELEADLIVTATGLNMLAFGGIELSVNGEAVHLPNTMTYKGMMLSGVPNMAYALGYTNASWTLKCDLTCEYLCRLLSHMDAHSFTEATPRNRDPSITEQPMIDFSSGYVQRAIDKFPKQGSKPPWRLYQNYARDILTLRRGPIEDEAIEFGRAAAPRAPAADEPTTAAAAA